MRTAAGAFVGLAILIIATIMAAMLFNPSRHEVSFVIQVIVVFGGLALWSTVAAWHMWTSQRTWPAYALISFLTVMVAMGVARYGSLQLDEPMHPVLSMLRTTTGVYILAIWFVLIRASLVSKADHRSVTQHDRQSTP